MLPRRIDSLAAAVPSDACLTRGHQIGLRLDRLPTAVPVKRDPEIHQDVRAELAIQQDEGRRSVEISVHHGVVSLTGLVESYAQKWAIEPRREAHRRRQGPARLSPRAPI